MYKPDDISHKNKNEFNSIIEDKNGDLWLGTNDGGLGKFDAGTKTFSWHSTENGLENTRIYGLLNDNSGNIWMSTDNGIFKFNTTSFKSKKYTYHDGLQGNSFWAHSYLKASDGFMYFGGKNGLTYFHPDSIKENPYPPQIVVTDLQIFNKSVVGNNKLPYTYDLYKNRQILLSYDQDVFSIHFAALHYSAPKKNSYKYMLEGHNNKWYNIGTQRFVTFSGLQAGSYNFRLKASNSSGVWNKKGISIKLIITPPFWETWWFRLVIFLLFVSIVYLIYRRRLANIRKIEMIRIKIAQDLHDEIGSNLGSIAVLSKMLKRKSIPDAKKTGYLDSIYTTAIKTAEKLRYNKQTIALIC
ncbi:MAG: hypothetical protein B6I20_13840 [Bacteroidetes bacterium 4572_117]|nr:MAG: hypothetical protein B6I20_13840 [Bacteroidetes bacterium 4572_117]